jgi:UDP-glucose 4-epimerase
MNEDMNPMPEDPYGIAKYAVEMELKATHKMFGLNYIIFRPHNVYGEYQNIGDRYRNVVGIFMNQLMQGKPLTIFGDGSQTRAFSYIGDVTPYIANSVNNKSAYNEIFNIGSGQIYSVNELAKATMDAMEVKGEIRYLELRNEAVHAYCDHSKAQKYFHIQSSVSLLEGLKAMADWAKKSGVRKSKRFKEIEIMDKLPPVWLE